MDIRALDGSPLLRWRNRLQVDPLLPNNQLSGPNLPRLPLLCKRFMTHTPPTTTIASTGFGRPHSSSQELLAWIRGLWLPWRHCTAI